MIAEPVPFRRAAARPWVPLLLAAWVAVAAGCTPRPRVALERSALNVVPRAPLLADLLEESARKAVAALALDALEGEVVALQLEGPDAEATAVVRHHLVHRLGQLGCRVEAPAPSGAVGLLVTISPAAAQLRLTPGASSTWELEARVGLRAVLVVPGRGPALDAAEGIARRDASPAGDLVWIIVAP